MKSNLWEHFFSDPRLLQHSLDYYHKMVIQSIARDANVAIEHDEGSRLSAGSDPSATSAAALKIVNFFPVKPEKMKINLFRFSTISLRKLIKSRTSFLHVYT